MIMTPKLTLNEFVALMSNMTGFSYDFIEEYTVPAEGYGYGGDVGYYFLAGDFKYHSWIKEDKYYYTQVLLKNEFVFSVYCEILSGEYLKNCATISPERTLEEIRDDAYLLSEVELEEILNFKRMERREREAEARYDEWVAEMERKSEDRAPVSDWDDL